MKKIISTILFLLSSFPVLAWSENNISQVADNYFDTFYFPSYPSDATHEGIHLYDNLLEDYSKSEVNRQIKTFKKFEKQTLALESSPDRDILLNSIRGHLLTLEVIKPWEKNPDYYSSGITTGAFVIISRQFAPATDRLKSLIAREKLMPAALLAAHENIKNPPKIYTEIALEQLPGLINFFQEDVPAAFREVTDTALMTEFNKTNKAVIKALQDYEVWLKNKVLPISRGDFRIGAEAYRKKLLYDEMVDTSLDKLIQIDLENMRQNQKQLIKMAKEIDPTKTPQQIRDELGNSHPLPDKLLPSFSADFDKAIQFIKDKHIITIPSDVRPIMEESPPFMRAFSLASMDTPGPFEEVAKEAYFNVTLPDKSWDQTRISNFLKHFSYPNISNTTVHEAYPGHYIQFLWMHNIPNRIRKIIGCSSNAEGWAHYSEQMMLDEGYGAEDPLKAKQLRFAQLLDALWRNARFMVGIKMHTGQMSFDQAVAFFEKEGYQTHAVGVIEAKRGTIDPTYLYYTLGKLEILKLRADLEAKQGSRFNLQKFHDDFMRQGFPPIKIVRKALLQDDSPTL